VMLCVDAIIPNGPYVLLINRKYPPYRGMWALPGGKLEADETLEECVVREVKEETGLTLYRPKLHAVYSDPDRDPRGRYISVVYTTTMWAGGLEAGDDASRARWMDITPRVLRELAFDHGKILGDYLQ